MGGTVIPDFTDDYTQPDSTPARSADALPDFSDDFAQSAPMRSMFDELKPRLKGLLDIPIAAGEAVGALATMWSNPQLSGEYVSDQMSKVAQSVGQAKDEFMADKWGTTKAASLGLVKGLIYEPLKSYLKSSTGLDPEADVHWERHDTPLGPVYRLAGKNINDEDIE